MILASSLQGLAVASLHQQARVGSVSQILIDQETAKIIGFIVFTGWFKEKRVVVFDDVAAIDGRALVINDIDNLVSIDEVVRAKKAYKNGYQLIGLKVITQTKKNLGRVNDYAISMTYGIVMQIMVKALLQMRIIPRSKIIKLSKKEIIVDDDTTLASPVPEAEPI